MEALDQTPEGSVALVVVHATKIMNGSLKYVQLTAQDSINGKDGDS